MFLILEVVKNVNSWSFSCSLISALIVSSLFGFLNFATNCFLSIAAFLHAGIPTVLGLCLFSKCAVMQNPLNMMLLNNAFCVPTKEQKQYEQMGAPDYIKNNKTSSSN